MANRARIPELLAPAGGVDAALAALAAGADAVYLGLGAFDARAASDGVTIDELAAICALAHSDAPTPQEAGDGAAPRRARVYVTLNALVHDDELTRAVAFARSAWSAGADAFIVADAGLARALAKALPGVELHLSTQAGVQDAAGVLLAARTLGVRRVTVARELSCAELAEVCATGVDIETFCHGAICVSYSGACSFSAMRSDRSAMRGDCTQPCRRSYRLISDDDAAVGDCAGHVPDAGRAPGAGRRLRGSATEGKLLCPRDYLGIRWLPALVEAGVAALKIEGRMKNPDYVYNVVSCYRRALDAIAAGEPLDDAALDALVCQLGRSFNRGFTDAYPAGRRAGAELMSPARSCNQGVRVGTIVARRPREVTIALDASVSVGDVLEICSTPGKDAPADVPERWPQVPCTSEGAAGERIEVRCKRRVEVGSPVNLVRSAVVLDATADVLARWHPAFERARAAGARHADRGDGSAAARGTVMVREQRSPAVPSAQHPPARRLVEIVDAPARAKAALARTDGVEVCAEAWRIADDPAWRGLVSQLTVMLDEVSRPNDASQDLIVHARRVVCRNLGQVERARQLGVPFDVAAPVGCWNASAAAWLYACGAHAVWLAPEFSLEAIEDMVGAARRENAPVPAWGVLVAGRAPLMVTEHCVLSVAATCNGACATCAHRRQPHALLDEATGDHLPVVVDRWGRTRVFDARPLDRVASAPALERVGVSAFAWFSSSSDTRSAQSPLH